MPGSGFGIMSSTRMALARTLSHELMSRFSSVATAWGECVSSSTPNSGFTHAAGVFRTSHVSSKLWNMAMPSWSPSRPHVPATASSSSSATPSRSMGAPGYMLLSAKRCIQWTNAAAARSWCH